MSIVNVKDLNKSFGEKVLFDNISFTINDGEKIGLLGVNGTGKSTLLNIIVGKEYYESGEINVVSKKRIEFLSQNPEYDEESTILDQIFKNDTKEMKILSEYEKILSDMEKGTDGLNERLLELSSIIEMEGLWSYESEVKSILTKLDIRDFELKMKTLSGGQRKRVALAAALICDCDLLILDEPTNHMDSDMVQWLEDYLNNRKGALLMVTHDRYFLDRVTNNIIEIDQGKLYRYSGNYTFYVEEKLIRQEIEASAKDKHEKLFKKELEWMRKGAKARTTKQKARIERFEDLKESFTDIKVENMEMSVSGTRLGRTIIDLKNISKGYGGKELLKEFTYVFKKKDRVGIVGPNGAGKSTLMKIIIGELLPDSGEVIIGKTVKLGYFSQENEYLNEEMRVIDYIKEGGEFFVFSEKEKISASKMLERFLFLGATQYNYISRLSGGEKRRLYLLRILMENPNVLMFDEPTNDLDLVTLNILEDFLDDFGGVAIIISHDRYFLDRVCNSIISYEGEGKLRINTGNFSDYLEKKAFEMEEASQIEEEVKKRDEYRASKTKKLKFTYNEQREYDSIESVIAELEEKIDKIDLKMESNSDDYVLLQDLVREKEVLDKALLEKYERWEYLNELSDKIKTENK